MKLIFSTIYFTSMEYQYQWPVTKFWGNTKGDMIFTWWLNKTEEKSVVFIAVKLVRLRTKMTTELHLSLFGIAKGLLVDGFRRNSDKDKEGITVLCL